MPKTSELRPIVITLSVPPDPREGEGKSTSSQNAVKHGLLARIPVLPFIERQAEWESHCERVNGGLPPAGYLESVLVEKVVLQLCRLKRLALCEHEVTAISFESLKDFQSIEDNEINWVAPSVGTVATVAAAKEAIRRIEFVLAMVASLCRLGQTEAFDSDVAAQLIKGVAEELDVDIYGNNELKFPDYPDGAARSVRHPKQPYVCLPTAHRPSFNSTRCVDGLIPSPYAVNRTC